MSCWGVCILPAFNEDPNFVRMFINEARLAAKLQHANIVQIYDFNHVEQIYFIAMEFVDGVDVRRLMKLSKNEASFPAEIAIHIGIEALRGLHYAHTKLDASGPLKIVHRDISPHNLLLSRSGELKITDFGIAKAASIASVTAHGVVKGKMTYMSPEQLAGEQIDGRSDVYCLGIVLWEILSGERRYGEVTSETSLVSQINSPDLPEVGSSRSDLPDGLSDVITRMLQMRRDDRYQSAADALRDLSRFWSPDMGLKVAAFLEPIVPSLDKTQDGTDVRALPSVAFQPSAQTRTIDTGESGLSVATVANSDTINNDVEIVAFSANDHVVASPVVGRLVDLGTDSTDLAHQSVSKRKLRAVIMLASAVLFVFIALLVRRQYEATDSIPLETAQATYRDSQHDDIEHKQAVTSEVAASLGQAATSLKATKQNAAADQKVVISDDMQPLDVVSRQKNSKDTGLDDVQVAEKPLSVPSPVVPKERSSQIAGKTRRASKSSAKHRNRKLRKANTHCSGRINVVVLPWGTVYIDGRKVGTTPVRGKKLSCGSHAVKISNGPLKKMYKKRLRVRSGKTVRIRLDWG